LERLSLRRLPLRRLPPMRRRQGLRRLRRLRLLLVVGTLPRLLGGHAFRPLRQTKVVMAGPWLTRPYLFSSAAVLSAVLTKWKRAATLRVCD